MGNVYINSQGGYTMGKFITPEGLKQLDSYKYKPGKYTWFDNALQPYWNYVVTLVPTWVAPNLITFVGWLCLLSSTLIILLHDFTFKHDIPGWCFFIAAISVWAYSTLDAIDGKQARRTQSSSALGQLFDHGCDAFSVSFLLINLGEATQLQNQHVFILFMGSYTAFWLSNWKEYNTGILLTNVGQFGVTECQIIATLIFILTGIFGQHIWLFSLYDILPAGFFESVSNQSFIDFIKHPLGGIIAYYFGILIFCLAIFELLRTLYQTREFKALKECFSLIVLMLTCSGWLWFSYFKEHIGIVLFVFGLLIAHLVCKIIISSVTKMKLETFHMELLPLMAATLLMFLLEQTGMAKLQGIVFWSFLLVTVVIAYRFLQKTIEQLSSHLKIYCFTLKKRPGHALYVPEQPKKQ